MRLLRWTGCLRSVHWLASSDVERDDITRAIGAQPITCVPESVAEVPAADGRWPDKSPRRLRAVFAARIAPTKNLLFLLEVLARCAGDIQLDIIGPLEDPDYWARCRAVMQRLPATVRVEYAGEATHRDLQRRLSTYDVMILPTLGENFGHIIVEAWAAGCPVLVSDRTPWRRLRPGGLGWDVPLEHEAWAAAIGECLDMGGHAHLAMRRRARTRARRVWQDGAAGDASLRRLLDDVSRRQASAPGRDLIAAGTSDIDPCA
jgi:glycosyltransferase involved in cell wall biosynthesis